MGILRDFEKRLEGAVEGFFARAFKSGLQPVELAKAVQRYAANYQQVGLDGVIVPNVYRFELSAEDRERFSGFEASLLRELADVVTRTAQERGWHLQGPPRIELRTADHVRVGTYELRGKVESPAREPAPAVASGGAPVRVIDERSPATSVLPSVTAPQAQLHVLAGPGVGQRHAVTSPALLGRLPECDVTLEDPSVSRRHARLSRDEAGRWQVEDLGSTNGVRVNGEPVGRATLHDGDRLELGGVRLAFAVGS